jgi:glycolate oxidase FAD binding subunit
MTERLAPNTPEDVIAAVQWAAANDAPLDIQGAGTKRGWGSVFRTNHVLDVSALNGVTLYEADELVLSAGPGTSLIEIQTLLAESGQQLAFEPPDLGPLFGQPAGLQTLGGVVATNLSGPRRIKSGGARDHFLGFSAVTGRGEAIKSGGRVVKNVTGYDLCKLFAGSFGTLGVMTTLTVKVLPAGEKTRTVLLYGLDDGVAMRALTHALNSAHEVSAAAHLPAAVAARSDVGYVGKAARSVTAVRVEGVGPSVEHRCAALRELLDVYGEGEELHGHNSRTLWREIGDVAPLLPDTAKAVWRLSVPPSIGPTIAQVCAGVPGSEWFYDW